MWPPQSVKTWPTPACFRTRATSWPPVRSATRQPGHHVRREALDLLALLRGGADRVEDDVVAAGGAKALDRLHALLGGADDPVLPREGLEVLRVALRERLGPHGLGRLVIAADGDEGQVCGGEALQLAPGGGRRRADLVEALRVALGLDHVRDPAVPLPAGACERGVGATTDPDGRPGLLHGLRVDRHALEIREAPLERRRRVAPQRAHDVDRLAHARAALGVRHAAQLELLRVLAADADAEDETPPGQHVERRGDLGGDRGRPQREQVDGGAEAQAARDRHVTGEQRERLVHRIVEGHVIAGPDAVEAERLDAADEGELLVRRRERGLDGEAQAAGAAEYAAKSLPGDITFLVATKTSAPPRPWEIRTRIASRATRKWPVELTANERSQSASAIRSTGAECATPALETRMSRPP